MGSNAVIFACFVAGIGAGRLDLLPDGYDSQSLSVWLIALLLFLIGLSVGSDDRTWSAFKTFGWRILLAPGSAVIGSFFGAAIVGAMLNAWSLRETLAVGFGLGYYSLSSVLIEQAHGSELAVIALMSNIFRELTTLLAAGPLCRVFGPIASVASGGATSSDVTLPAIVNASGPEYTVPAVFNGAFLSLLVPILVTLALGR